jgi:hypothetical protein
MLSKKEPKREVTPSQTNTNTTPPDPLVWRKVIHILVSINFKDVPDTRDLKAIVSINGLPRSTLLHDLSISVIGCVMLSWRWMQLCTIIFNYQRASHHMDVSVYLIIFSLMSVFVVSQLFLLQTVFQGGFFCESLEML